MDIRPTGSWLRRESINKHTDRHKNTQRGKDRVKLSRTLTNPSKRRSRL
jgi:hypothetical protein